MTALLIIAAVEAIFLMLVVNFAVRHYKFRRKTTITEINYTFVNERLLGDPKKYQVSLMYSSESSTDGKVDTYHVEIYQGEQLLGQLDGIRDFPHADDAHVLARSFLEHPDPQYD